MVTRVANLLTGMIECSRFQTRRNRKSPLKSGAFKRPQQLPECKLSAAAGPKNGDP